LRWAARRPTPHAGGRVTGTASLRYVRRGYR
jgi:hypothetical protein